MKHTVYKTTNQVNGKIYIGIHRTENPEDDYLGSGNLLRKAIVKYGATSFTKEVLFVYDNLEEMIAKEAELVTVEFCRRRDTYNLMPGGYQNIAYYQNLETLTPEEKTRFSLLGNQRQRELAQTDPAFRDRQSQRGTLTLKLLHSQGRVPYDNFKGRTHTEASKKLIASVLTGKSQGELNSQHGSVWVSCGDISRKIPQTDLERYLLEGWEKGRSRLYQSQMSKRHSDLEIKPDNGVRGKICLNHPTEGNRFVLPGEVANLLANGWRNGSTRTFSQKGREALREVGRRVRAQQQTPTKGKVWAHRDGVEAPFFPDQIPEGWVQGMLPRFWVSNGSEERRVRHPKKNLLVAEGWRSGRLQR